MISAEEQLRNKANFRDETGKLFLVRCEACNSENWAPAVAAGYCAFCLWSEADGDMTVDYLTRHSEPEVI